jgi:hypothetical protein
MNHPQSRNPSWATIISLAERRKTRKRRNPTAGAQPGTVARRIAGGPSSHLGQNLAGLEARLHRVFADRLTLIEAFSGGTTQPASEDEHLAVPAAGTE